MAPFVPVGTCVHTAPGNRHVVRCPRPFPSRDPGGGDAHLFPRRDEDGLGGGEHTEFAGPRIAATAGVVRNKGGEQGRGPPRDGDARADQVSLDGVVAGLGVAGEEDGRCGGGDRASEAVRDDLDGGALSADGVAVLDCELAPRADLGDEGAREEEPDEHRGEPPASQDRDHSDHAKRNE